MHRADPAQRAVRAPAGDAAACMSSDAGARDAATSTQPAAAGADRCDETAEAHRGGVQQGVQGDADCAADASAVAGVLSSLCRDVSTAQRAASLAPAAAAAAGAAAAHSCGHAEATAPGCETDAMRLLHGMQGLDGGWEAAASRQPDMPGHERQAPHFQRVAQGGPLSQVEADAAALQPCTHSMDSVQPVPGVMQGSGVRGARAPPQKSAHQRRQQPPAVWMLTRHQVQLLQSYRHTLSQRHAACQPVRTPAAKSLRL